jgi:hypothetical protein
MIAPHVRVKGGVLAVAKSGTDPTIQSRQREQQRLLREASSQPGVSEAMAAYGALVRYGGSVKNELPALRYGTGGNLHEAR